MNEQKNPPTHKYYLNEIEAFSKLPVYFLKFSGI